MHSCTIGSKLNVPLLQVMNPSHKCVPDNEPTVFWATIEMELQGFTDVKLLLFVLVGKAVCYGHFEDECYECGREGMLLPIRP